MKRVESVQVPPSERLAEKRKRRQEKKSGEEGNCRCRLRFGGKRRLQFFFSSFDFFSFDITRKS